MTHASTETGSATVGLVLGLIVAVVLFSFGFVLLGLGEGLTSGPIAVLVGIAAIPIIVFSWIGRWHARVGAPQLRRQKVLELGYVGYLLVLSLYLLFQYSLGISYEPPVLPVLVAVIIGAVVIWRGRRVRRRVSQGIASTFSRR